MGAMTPNAQSAPADRGPVPHPAEQVTAARAAQPEWARRLVRGRLAVMRSLRHEIARAPERLLDAMRERPNRGPTETLLAELLPLADACRFLERTAARLLAPRRLGHRGRPTWLSGVAAEIRREPLGVVLIIAPDNYPLLLPGVQTVQALTAGNAVLIKPAPTCRAPAVRLSEALLDAGLPPGLCQVLGENVADAEAAIAAGVDHVVLTGSAATGRALLGTLAPRLVPATLELSGNDGVFVLPSADLELVADALAYGLRLNGGATCIAPRRVFVPHELAPALERALGPRLAAAAPATLPQRVHRHLHELLDEVVAHGGRVIPALPDRADAMRPIAVLDADPEWRLLREDVFAPVVSLVPVRDFDEALALDRRCPYGLGASIFGPPEQARELASRVPAGSISINDLIVPTADPRLPFGGRGDSGYGVTRGAEGLLAMTRIKTISLRRGRFRPHYRSLLSTRDEAEAASAYLRAAHGAGMLGRLAALARLVRALIRVNRRRNSAS